MIPLRVPVALLVAALLLPGCVIPGFGVSVGGGHGPADPTVLKSWDVALGTDVAPLQSGTLELPFELPDNASSLQIDIQLSGAAPQGVMMTGPQGCAWTSASPAAGSISHVEDCHAVPRGGYTIRLQQPSGTSTGTIRVVWLPKTPSKA